ncbi:hypothetical protein CCP3SC1_700008 [Gammaproteobacteria bacterium]
MEEPDSEELGEGWTEKPPRLLGADSVQQSAHQRRHGRWRSVEEYQEWRQLRQKLNDLESF